MGNITIFHIGDKFFLPIHDGIREIPFATVSQWMEQGAKVDIREGEQYV